MKVILSQDVKELGKKGQIKEVSEGYARNFLLPKGLAVLASEGNIRSIEQVKKAQESKAERGKTDALKLAAKLKDCTLHLLTRSGEGGKLFGSVTNTDIAKALADKGYVIDKRKIELKEAIKAVGTYHVDIKVYPDIVATISVVVGGK